MLDIIFGNKTAARILRSLEKRGEVYATALSTNLGIPVNMIQKQLERFERGSLLVSEHVGRRKVYRWNQEFPLRREIQNLLKRFDESSDPADGTHLTYQERIDLAENLRMEAESLNPYPRYRPFVKIFDDLKSYERWYRKQNNPWLI